MIPFVLEIIQLLLCWLVERTNPTGDSCSTMWTGVNYKRYWVSEKMNGCKHTQQSTERTTVWESFWGIRNIAAIAGRNKCDAGSLDIWIVSKIYIVKMFCVENNVVWLLAGITVIRMEATKQQSTEHIIMNQPRQQAQFHDSCCPLGCCFSPLADSSFRVPEVASGSRCHCRFAIMK